MVNNPNICHFHHHHHDRKVGKFDLMVTKEDELKLMKRAKWKLFSLLCLCFLSCTLIWLPLFLAFPFPLSYILSNFVDSIEAENYVFENVGSDPPAPSLASNGTIYCDRSHFRTDLCYMKGDIRTHSPSSSIFSYISTNGSQEGIDDKHEIIKPYTRKWETSIMNTIQELTLISKSKPSSNSAHECDVWHDVPAVFFSTGGYTGNVYHEFNDGIIPLYISSQHFNKKVVFVILEYHDWWYTKYASVLSELSDYPPIDFKSDSRTHCFQEAIVGLKIHDELTIDSSLIKGHKTIVDFRNLLGRAFDQSTPYPRPLVSKRPKLLILSRRGSRSLTNEHSLVRLAQKVGFNVQVLKPSRKTELATMYKEVSTSDVMVAVHGATMTHFLFLKPGSGLIQVIPLGTDWASESYYGDPAKKLGLKYIGYKISPMESSLYHKYKKNDPILIDPDSVNKKGWEFTKKIYLDDQNVTLDLKRFKKLLVQAYEDYHSLHPTIAKIK